MTKKKKVIRNFCGWKSRNFVWKRSNCKKFPESPNIFLK